MHKTSQKRFIHSVKVPRIYKVASVIVKKVVEEGGSLKDLVYSSGHKNIKGIYALVVEAIKHSNELDRLIKITKLLQKETRLQPWLARILITELIYGKKELKGESKPVLTILSYKKQFEKLFFCNSKNSETINCTVKKPRYVRINTLHFTPDEAIKIFRKEGWSFFSVPSEYSDFLEKISHLENDAFTRDFHIKELLVFPESAKFYENELYQKGSILLQDKASCLPAFLLNPKPNSIVLDMCAAPGMKTTHLSAIMKNRGRIYATEINSRRFEVLQNLIQMSGCTNVFPLNVDALNLNENERNVDLNWTQDVEYILVDPSCSGSGMVDRMKIFSGEKNDPRRLKKLCGFQFKLLKHALTNFPKVKRVVYSTCSLDTRENEKVVEDVLEKLSAEGDDKKKFRFRLGEPLKSSWPRRGSDEYKHGRQCIFSDPEKDLTNGFFVAVFEREEENVDYSEEDHIEDKEGRKRPGTKFDNNSEKASDWNSDRKATKRKKKEK